MGKVRVEEQIKRGFAYDVVLTWEAAFLPGTDTIRADLRQTPATDLLVPFNVTRTVLGDGRIETKLSLTKVQTAALPLGSVQTEPVIVSGANEFPVDLILTFEVRDHTTRAAA